MSKLWEAISDLLSKLFGGNDVRKRLKVLDGMEERFSVAKRDNEDSLQNLKDDIKALETRALQKKRELEQSHGDTKRIIVGEIERVFRELDGLRGRENVIAANLERIRGALAKTGEAKVALRAGMSEDQLDTLALEMQDLYGELKSMDRAAVDLEKETYLAPGVSDVNVEKRLAESQGECESPAVLSAETAKRLKQLETV